MAITDAWGRLRDRYRQTLETYGKVAFGVWFGMFFLTVAGFWTALQVGVDLDAVVRGMAERLHLDTGEWSSVTSGAGKLVVAYAATQVTKPIRFVIFVVVTPIVARKLGYVQKDPEAPPTNVVDQPAQ
jgi:hypothetical protein